MDEPTEAPCPVCAEPLAGRPDRCFRCETALLPWWRFEDALRQAGPGGASASGGSRRAVMAGSALLVMAVIVAGAVLLSRRPPAPVVLAPATPVVAPATAPEIRADPPPATFSYRVQRGDSLWRIAASLTGDGRRWRELWPQHAGQAARIAPGTVLEVDLRRLAAAR